MEFIDAKLNDYAESHSTAESIVLKELNRETWSKVLMPRMLSGHLQGRILSMFSHMIRPHQILEIGTYTGYSAICMAEGLANGGVLHTIDVNDELAPMVDRYIQRAGMKDRIVTHIGPATDIIPTLPGPFDLVFIDADKENYSNYFDLVIEKLGERGFIIADNVLWSGKVLQNVGEMDEETRALHEFNIKIHNDKRVENVLMPVRDGLMVVRKIR